jgi:HAMP domain-containing protein
MITVNTKLFYILVITAVILFFAWVVQFDEIRSLEKKIDTIELEQNNMFTFITEGN